MKTFIAAGFLASWAVVVACGGAQKSSYSAAPAGSAETSPSPMPGDPHNEIDRLAAEIDTALANAGAATGQPSACATSHSCTAEPYGMPPRIEDPTCKPAATDVCTQACTLSDSVCSNADKICKIAKQLGGSDDYANDKCQSGNDSCKRTREKCCGC